MLKVMVVTIFVLGWILISAGLKVMSEIVHIIFVLNCICALLLVVPQNPQSTSSDP